MGQNFIREAEYSAKLLKQSNEDIPATLVTDREPSTDYIDKTITIDDPEYTFADKPFNMNRLP
ncbi:MAG: hypothetical protein ABEI52_09520, partial [Halobacteriaceae archaeon]